MRDKSFVVGMVDIWAINMKRIMLANYLEFLQPAQRALFDKLYPKGVPDSKIDHALFQCETTIRHNSLGDRPKNETGMPQT